MIHLESELHSAMPTCGRADFDRTELVTDPAKVTCWECKAIADIPDGDDIKEVTT